VHGLDALDHRLIESIQIAALILDRRMIGEHLKDRVHRTAHGVLLGERMIREHRVKERRGENVLGQHLHRRLVVHGRVLRRAQQSCDQE